MIKLRPIAEGLIARGSLPCELRVGWLGRVATSLVLSIFFVLAVDLSEGIAQGTPPTLSIGLVLNSTKYLLGDLPTIQPEPIQAQITIRNTGTQPIITSAGFSEKPFHLFLTFVGPDGKPITAAEGSPGTHESGPPRVVPVDGALVAVEEVEVLPGGFTKTITVPDLRAFYNLTLAGRYSVKAVVPIRTYSSFFTANGKNYANLDSFSFAGTLETANRFSLIADADGDGYSFPEPDSRLSAFTVPDCDDNDPQVNPGKPEIAGDGKDNDCNPSTLDSGIAVVPGFVFVGIDIMPGTIPNLIKLSSKGTVPVAVFSTATFDAAQIIPKTVTLAGAPVALNSKKQLMWSLQDVNLDGRRDLLVHFNRNQLNQLIPGSTQAQLLGKTNLVDVQGLDSVQVIP